MRLFLGLFLLGASLAQATVVYTENFELGTAPGFSGAGTVQSSQGLSAFGFGQNHLRNEGAAATVLTLSGLAAHTTITLQFDLAMWDSIDFGDTFQVRLDGNFLYNGTWGNYFSPGSCAGGFGCIVGPVGSTQLTPAAIDFSNPAYGYNNSNRDSAHRMSITVAHTGSTATFDWRYPDTQGAPDESFGIDNIIISTDAIGTNEVPEPSTWMMLAGGIGMLALRRFRR